MSTALSLIASTLDKTRTRTQRRILSRAEQRRAVLKLAGVNVDLLTDKQVSSLYFEKYPAHVSTQLMERVGR
jgi:hypothetical protein